MKFTLSWLKSHLDTDKTSKEIEDKLSLIGLEIEECIDNSKIFEPFIIAEIQESTKHENAENLSVCRVFDGTNTHQIVCGAANAKSGVKVVLAPIGSEIPANGMVIKHTKIRGVESNGMLCSAEELLLEDSSEGIIELPKTAPVGENYGEFANLNDVLFEIGLTPNRGDCTYVRGIARDLSAAGMGTLKSQSTEVFKNNGKETPVTVTIEEKEACRDFTLTKIENIANGSESEYSPLLRKIGFSPKSTLVDLSNFFMMDLGRPNHIYDADKITGNFSIRYSKKGEKFTPISMDEIELPEGLLVVSDDTHIVSIAGVIGGDLSKVTDTTKNILVEMANFDPLEIIKSGRALNIHTDSRFRFERRIDFANREMYLDTFYSQILKECGGDAYKLSVTTGDAFSFTTEMNFDFSYIKHLSGVEVSQEEATEILKKLGFGVDGNKITIPSYRQGDVESKADIVEEIIRIKGFDCIEHQLLPTSEKHNLNYETPFVDKLKFNLAARGLNEVFTWSFIDSKLNDLFGFEDAIELVNPISSEMSVMRKSLLPSMMLIQKKNADLGTSDICIFEVASIFEKENPHKLNKVVCGARFGKYSRKSVHKEERNFDFYDSKADLFNILSEFGLNPDKLQYKQNFPGYYHPGKSCSFYLGKNLIAHVGEVHPKIQKHFDITDGCTAFELFIDNLPELRRKSSKPQLTLHKLQAVIRDFAFLINDSVTSLEIKRAILSTDKKLITDVAIFDVYKGKGIDEGFKSIALSVTIQPIEKTLNDAEIEVLSKKIIDTVTEKFGAKLR